MTTDQEFAKAVALHRQSRLVEAESAYRGVLRRDANHFGALHYLGLCRMQQGQPGEAEALLRKALVQDPASAEAHNNLGIALAALGRPHEALLEYEASAALDPNHIEARNNLGNALSAADRLGEAITHLESAISARPQVAELHNNLGNVLLALNRTNEALASFHKALALRPDFAEAHNNLGFVLMMEGRLDHAVVEFERALALNPNYFEARNGLANALSKLKRYADAVPHFERALALKPDTPEVHNNFGNALAALNCYADAVAHFKKAIQIKPDFFEAYNNLGIALVASKRGTEAIAHFQKALELKPDFADAYCNLGDAFEAAGRHDDVMEAYRKAIAIDPDMAAAHAGLGNELRIVGRLGEARDEIHRAVELAPRNIEFHYSLAQSKQFSAGDRQLKKLEELASEIDSLSDDERILLHFVLGKAHTDFGEYEKAFRHLLEGNALKRRQVNYAEAAIFAKFERLKAVFTPELVRGKQGLGDPTNLPIFIIGMPRSGTTLVEQILASHPKVTGAGEVEHMRPVLAKLEAGSDPFPEAVASMDATRLREIAADYLSALGTPAPPAERITDKSQGNFVISGLIHLAMPRSPIIHVRRDPLDTCVSCFSRLFMGDIGFSYDLAELGRYYRAYEALMAHWQRVLPVSAILEVQYEQLVADFEPQVRRLVAYCGLEWDDRCLSFHATQRPVRTASAAQVRQPLYDSSVGRSRMYQDMLAPLVRALEGDI